MSVGLLNVHVLESVETNSEEGRIGWNFQVASTLSRAIVIGASCPTPVVSPPPLEISRDPVACVGRNGSVAVVAPLRRGRDSNRFL